MKVVYDPENNILQISFTSRGIAETAQIAPDLILDYDIWFPLPLGEG